MPIGTTPVPTPSPSPAPSPPGRPERAGRTLVAGAAVGVALALGLILLLAIGLLGAVVVLRASDSSSPQPGDIAVQPAEPADTPDAVIRFIADWTSGEWTEMGQYADAAVVETARRSYVEGMVVEIVGPVTDQGGELLVTDPAGGRASVFVLTLGNDAGIARLDGLAFAGDAG